MAGTSDSAVSCVSNDCPKALSAVVRDVGVSPLVVSAEGAVAMGGGRCESSLAVLREILGGESTAALKGPPIRTGGPRPLCLVVVAVLLSFALGLFALGGPDGDP